MPASPPRSTRATRRARRSTTAWSGSRKRRSTRAELVGKIARVTVRFVADIAAVTRDKDGTVVAGSLDDAIEARDIWTFMRDVRDADPDWLLDETDEG